MDKKLEKIIQALQNNFGATVEEFRDEAHVFVKVGQIIEALTLLRNKHEFELLSTMTVVDYWPRQSPRFHLVYQLTSLAQNMSVQLRVPLNGDQPKVPTAAQVYQVANWREREAWDMFGIEFEGHPDPRSILLPDDQIGHPLRKDFPLGYEEPQFSFNFEEIGMRKPDPKK